MKRIIGLVLTLLSLTAFGQSTNNAIKMGYNFTTVSQTVVFNSAMQLGGTMTFTTQAMDGGGRNPGDPFTMKLVFYNASNQVVNTVQTAFTLSLGAPLYNFTVTATNCGGSCAGVTYVSVQFYGKDGGYWAGNYGPYIINPSLTFNGGSNILYNPEFGVYGTNGFAQGWSSTAGWQNCALYAGAATCVVNNGAPVNAAGGGYSSTGGTTSSPAGGQSSAPPPPVYTSSITAAQQTRKDSAGTRRTAISNSGIYIDQVGDNNTVTVTQEGNNKITGIGQQSASIQGNSNTVTIRQGTATGSTTGKNLLELSVVGDSNTVNLNQGKNSDGTNPGLDSNNHYQMLNLSGSNNSITTVQKDGTNSGAGHFMENTVSGNSNVINLTQQGSGSKVLFTNVNGNTNTVNVNQKDTGTHYLDVGLVGNGHTVNATQEGTGNHKATISLTNAGAGGTVNLNQLSGTGQVYSIQQSCATSSCGATITQGQ